MTVPTNIPETLIVHTDHKSLQGYKNTNTSISLEIFQHVVKTVMDIKMMKKWNPSLMGYPTDGMTTSLVFVLIFTISWIVSMIAVNTK